MYLMAGLLLVGAVCNYLITPVHSRHHFVDPSSREQRHGQGNRREIAKLGGTVSEAPDPSRNGDQLLRLILSWLWVGIPLAWGVSQTIIKSLDLFK